MLLQLIKYFGLLSIPSFIWILYIVSTKTISADDYNNHTVEIILGIVIYY